MDMAKRTAKSGRSAKRPAVTLTGMANAPVRVDVRITDPEYPLDTLGQDIEQRRVWSEVASDKGGWVKLLYSADGPTGDPWQIGKVRIALDSEGIDGSALHTLSGLTFRAGGAEPDSATVKVR